jgi:predicted NAD-dependent protein-ADP-ribosyltransferase YbiA (DUF1768 family)
MRFVDADEYVLVFHTHRADDLPLQETAEQMMKTTVPSEHQALGRKAKGFNRAVWDQRE